MIAPASIPADLVRALPKTDLHLHLDGSLRLEASGGLAVDAKHVAIHGREGLTLSSGRDANIEVAGDLHSHARIQNLTADLGNVNVKANDDVMLNGERVMVNC